MTLDYVRENSALSGKRSILPSVDSFPVDEARFARLLREISDSSAQESWRRAFYARTLFRLQCELVKLQQWVQAKKLKVIVIVEGRDAAGKGGLIKRFTHRLDPRLCRVVALGTPSDRERTQWYFQRYVGHFPAGGEIVFFDRSWYNRAGVEHVMGFCTDVEYEEFLESVPHFESMVTRSGIVLVKYWLSISFEEQRRRLMARLESPFKEWKLSPIDIESLKRWDSYTKAEEAMFRRTHCLETPWWIVDADDKRRARLNCITHFLSQISYDDVPGRKLSMPEQAFPPQGPNRSWNAFHVPLAF